MADFPIEYKEPFTYQWENVPDEKVNIGDFKQGRRLKMDYTIYNTYDEPVLRDRLFTTDEKNRDPAEYFINSLDLIYKKIIEPFAVATSTAQKAGYTDFTRGSPGYKKREEILEALKKEIDNIPGFFKPTSPNADTPDKNGHKPLRAPFSGGRQTPKQTKSGYKTKVLGGIGGVLHPEMRNSLGKSNDFIQILNTLEKQLTQPLGARKNGTLYHPTKIPYSKRQSAAAITALTKPLDRKKKTPFSGLGGGVQFNHKEP